MSTRARRLVKRLLFVPAVLAGAGALAWLGATHEGPRQTPPEETVRTVRVITVPEVRAVPRAVGYGNVQPGMVWEAVAEVRGRVVEIHPRLKSGEILPEGAVLLRLDATDYELAINQIEANIRSTKAELAELVVREGNTRTSLEIEEDTLRLRKVELERKQSLARRGNVSESAVDEQRQNVLAQEQKVQELRNALNLIPAEREALAAQLELNKAQLATARRDLERTTITAPFDIRAAEVNVERAQFAQQGQVLAVGDSIDVAEVAAQLPIDRFRRLLPRKAEAELTLADMDKLPDLLGLSAKVRLRSGDFTVEWDARFARISDTVDPQTRTVGVIVAVDNPYRKARPGLRPPLVKNMFVEAELAGPPRPPAPVIPRSALHQGAVYVVDADGRLEIREVEIALEQGDFAVIESGLREGERIVVSDPVPAIEGMRLDPVPDDELARALVAEAEGAGPLR